MNRRRPAQAHWPRAAPTRRRALALALSSLALAGCGASVSTTSSGGAPPAPGAAPVTARTPPPQATATARTAPARTTATAHRATTPIARASAVNGLPHSTASAAIVQPQPPPGSCHARGAGLDERPDPSCTPGALNPAVTPATIDDTICVDGWTATVRPPESVTEPEKQASLAAYGDTGSAADYEYDHLVPLELGGAVNDPRNLWPEPGASPNRKDGVEDALRAEVCAGSMSLAAAQRAIVADWVSLAGAPPAGPAAPPADRATSPGPAASTPSSSGSAQCTVTATPNARYGDYDVDVHSNVPDATVAVTDAAGHTRHWHTDATGYADVYFRPGPGASGESVTAQVGAARCSTSL